MVAAAISGDRRAQTRIVVAAIVVAAIVVAASVVVAGTAAPVAAVAAAGGAAAAVATGRVEPDRSVLSVLESSVLSSFTFVTLVCHKPMQ